MFTTNKFTDYVNMALNYPAVSFDDIRLYLDQAISEINTELHTSIIDLDAMDKAASNYVSNLPNLIVITSEEASLPILISAGEPSVSTKFYFDSTKNKYGIRNVDMITYSYYDILYGVRLIDGVATYYKAGDVVASNIKVWYKDDIANPSVIDLENYFTTDWIKLFLVPYVCYKYCIRDGDNLNNFNEEFAQGFQQLRHTYNVPFQVILATVADKFAYKEDVIKHLPNLKVWCLTRAITEDMKNPQGVNATYRDFYDVGGFGL